MILLLTVAIVALGLYFAIRVAGAGIRRSIWRLRNRLLVTYLFIAVIPVILILALAAVGTWIVAGQVAVNLVTSELGHRVAALEPQARILSQAKPADQATLIARMTPLIAGNLPGAEITVDPDPARLNLPSGDYTGYVVNRGQYYAASLVHASGTVALVMAPLDADLLAKLVPGIGILNITQSSGALKRNYIAGRLPPAASVIDFPTPWWGRLSFADWSDPSRPAADALLVIQTRPSADPERTVRQPYRGRTIHPRALRRDCEPPAPCRSLRHGHRRLAFAHHHAGCPRLV